MTTKEQNHLQALNIKHKMLSAQLEEYLSHPSVDDATIQQLKKEKLAVKDEITEFKRSLASTILVTGTPKD